MELPLARALFAAPVDPITSAQLASLRARVRQLEAEVAELRAAALVADVVAEVAVAHAAAGAGVTSAVGGGSGSTTAPLGVRAALA